jgi:hypothetical protein
MFPKLQNNFALLKAEIKMNMGSTQNEFSLLYYRVCLLNIECAGNVCIACFSKFHSTTPQHLNKFYPALVIRQM